MSFGVASGDVGQWTDTFGGEGKTVATAKQPAGAFEYMLQAPPTKNKSSTTTSQHQKTSTRKPSTASTPEITPSSHSTFLSHVTVGTLEFIIGMYSEQVYGIPEKAESKKTSPVYEFAPKLTEDRISSGYHNLLGLNKDLGNKSGLDLWDYTVDWSGCDSVTDYLARAVELLADYTLLIAIGGSAFVFGAAKGVHDAFAFVNTFVKQLSAPLGSDGETRPFSNLSGQPLHVAAAKVAAAVIAVTAVTVAALITCVLGNAFILAARATVAWGLAAPVSNFAADPAEAVSRVMSLGHSKQD